MKASRKKRIAAGSGAKVEDLNRLLKQHRTTADMMKSMNGAKRGPMAQMAQMFGLGGGMPQPSPEEIAALQQKFGGGAGMGAGIPQSPPPGGFAAKPASPSLPGLGGKPAGLPWFGRPPGLPVREEEISFASRRRAAGLWDCRKRGRPFELMKTACPSA